jgi:hypothetical protein
MADVNDDLLAQLETHEDTMQLDEFVRRIETHHPTDGPGASRETLEAYAKAVYYDVDLSAIDDRLTDSDDWEAGKHLYELGDGRISDYPPAWHETLGGTDDVKDIIETIENDVTEPEGTIQESVTDEGIPEQKIYRVGKAVAGIEEGDAREQIKRLRKDGEIEEFASQSRNPRLRLS